MLKLFTTNVGSHMWQMNHEKSDSDLHSVFMMDSKDFMLGKKKKGKFTQKDSVDTTCTELNQTINQLLKGNVNYLWAVMSPIFVEEYKSALRELREIVSSNLAKNCFHSINGLAKHNIYHFVTKGDRYSDKYKKKLNVIGRSLKFGIGILTWGKCLFEKVDIKSEEELWSLKDRLNASYNNSALPDKPDPEPFEKYLIKWRLYKMKLDEII